MADVWARLEPHLASVQKPARYIGCELGAEVPAPAPHRVGWLLVYPDTYEIGLPNQGLQILYEILNERDDALAERVLRPLDRPRGGPAPGGHPAVLGGHAPQRRRVRRHRLQPVLRARLHQRPQLPRPGRRARAQRRSHRRAPAGRRGRSRHLQPRAARRLPRLRRARRRRGGGQRDQRRSSRPGRTAAAHDRRDVLRALAGIEGVYVPAPLRGPLPARRPAGGHDADRRRPPRPWSRSAPIADLGDWPYPKQQLVPLTEVVHDRLNVEVFRGCTRGCRFCQAGMITRPVRERPAEQVRVDGAAGPAPHRATTRSRSPASPRPTSPASRTSSRRAMDDDVGCGNVSVSLPSLRVDAFTVGVAAQIQKARRTGLTFAPEAGTWRMRQVINKLITEEDLYAAVDVGLQPGLAAREALLPHRPAHRDRRGHPRHRRAGPALPRAGQGQRTQRRRSP